MSGWLAMIGLSLLSAMAVLLFTKGRRQLWQPVAATLALAMAGYAWQGRPALPEVPAKDIAEERGAAAALIKMRADMDQNFGQAKNWLNISDGFARDGNYRAAAGIIQGGLREYPENPDLWSALGVVLLLAGDGKLTPPAQLAFSKARAFGQAYPAPDYFEGLAALFERKPDQTLSKWRAVLERTTPKAEYRSALESQIKGLEAILASPELSNSSKNINVNQRDK